MEELRMFDALYIKKAKEQQPLLIEAASSTSHIHEDNNNNNKNKNSRRFD
jgi:hypothetical protein